MCERNELLFMFAFAFSTLNTYFMRYLSSFKTVKTRRVSTVVTTKKVNKLQNTKTF